MRSYAFSNALTGSFFATLECEQLDHQIFRTHDAARSAVFAFIESF
jgi:putative transposase